MEKNLVDFDYKRLQLEEKVEHESALFPFLAALAKYLNP
jgi:hypothetical protein